MKINLTLLVACLIGMALIAPLTTKLANAEAALKLDGNLDASRHQPVTTDNLVTWAKSYGGDNEDSARGIVPSADGGFLIVGSTYSFGAGYDDAWVFKVDGMGSLVWQKAYGVVGGGGGHDLAIAIARTNDGNYVVAGGSSPGECCGSTLWVIKIDESGKILWQKSYPGKPGSDFARDIFATPDAGYVVAGITDSYGAGQEDAWVLKLDGSGNVVWQKTYGGSGTDDAKAIRPTTDGGYVVAGFTSSFGGSDAWVIKLNSSGDVAWQKTFGGDRLDGADSIYTTADGGYIVGGQTLSFGSGFRDGWVFKLDQLGNMIWQKAYGGPNEELISSIRPTADGGSIAVGYLNNNLDYPAEDVWVLKLDGSGNIVWQKSYGGRYRDWADAVYPAGDSTYAIAGYSDSFGRINDAWVLRLDPNGNLGGSCSPAPNSSAAALASSAVIASTTLTSTNTTSTAFSLDAHVTDTLAKTSTQSVRPAKPVLVSPSNGATLTNQEVLLDWKRAAGALSYKALVKQDSRTGPVVFKQDGITATRSTTTPLPRDHGYDWRVIARNLCGNSKSIYQQFSIAP